LLWVLSPPVARIRWSVRSNVSQSLALGVKRRPAPFGGRLPGRPLTPTTDRESPPPAQTGAIDRRTHDHFANSLAAHARALRPPQCLRTHSTCPGRSVLAPARGAARIRRPAITRPAGVRCSTYVLDHRSIIAGSVPHLRRRCRSWYGSPVLWSLRLLQWALAKACYSRGERGARRPASFIQESSGTSRSPATGGGTCPPAGVKQRIA